MRQKKQTIWSKLFQRTIIDAAKTKGWHVDQTGNIDRVLRLPGTSNFKTGTARPVNVIFEGAHFDKRVVLATASKPSLSATQATPASVAGATSAVPAATATPSAVSPLLEDTKKRLRNLRSQTNRQLMMDVLSGRPFAKPGHRDAELQRVCSLIAFVLEHPDKTAPEPLAELLRPSLEAMQAESDDSKNPALTIDDAIEKLRARVVGRHHQARGEKSY